MRVTGPRPNLERGKGMSTPSPDIEKHPDVAALRQRYDEIAETPLAHSADGLAFLAGVYVAMSPWVVAFTDHSAGKRRQVLVVPAAA